MPGNGPVMRPVPLVYRYDGGLAGLYTCVFECMLLKQLPIDIVADGPAGLLAERWVDTDPAKAERVRTGIAKKISPAALELVETVFLSCMEHRELATLRFLVLGFREGERVLEMLAHPDVIPMLNAQKHLFKESHLLKGFIRFSDYDGKLVAIIGPKNFVLPFLAGHFSDRFARETFMIYDEKHGVALIHEPGRTEMVHMEALAEFTVSEEEARYRALWKQFYKTIGIQARVNPRLRRGLLPKRYWPYMTEMQDLLDKDAKPGLPAAKPGLLELAEGIVEREAGN